MADAELIRAAEHGDLSAVQDRLAMGASPNGLDERGTTALIEAVRGDHLEIAAALLERGADPNVNVGTGRLSALMVAWTRHGYPREMLDLLVEHGADVSEHHAELEQPVIFAAAREGDPALMKRLLESGAAVTGQTLDRAAWSGETEALGLALSGPIDPREVERDKRLAGTDVRPGQAWRDVLRKKHFLELYRWGLRGAASRGNLDSLQQLLTADEIRLDQDAVGAAWKEALKTDQVPILRHLLEHVVPTTSELLTSALVEATCGGASGAVNYLLEAGADPNASLASGSRPLHEAARSRARQAIEVLLMYGAQIDGRDREGRTPLMIACGDAAPVMVATLLEQGARPNLADEEGRTPYQWLEASPAQHDPRKRSNVDDIRRLLQTHGGRGRSRSKGRLPVVLAGLGVALAVVAAAAAGLYLLFPEKFQ